MCERSCTLSSLAATLTPQTLMSLEPGDTVELQECLRVADRNFAADQTTDTRRVSRGPVDRRSPTQKKLEDRAFRVRSHVLAPERGFPNRLLGMHRWLDAEIGRGNFAAHGATAGQTQVTALETSPRG